MATPKKPKKTFSLLVPVVLILSFFLTACSIRFETAPQATVAPDANEIARQAAVSDIVLIHADALAAASLFPKDSATYLALMQAVDFSALHSRELGGVKESDSETIESTPSVTLTTLAPDGTPTVTPSATESPSDEEDPTVETVVTELSQSAWRIRASIDTVKEPGLARLLTSVSVSQAQLSQNIASASGIVIEEQVRLENSAIADLKSVLESDVLNNLIIAEDSLGFAFESYALTLSEKLSDPMTNAATHRKIANYFVKYQSKNALGLDPRQVAYTIAQTWDEQSASQEIIAALKQISQNYSSLSGIVDPEDRPLVIDLLMRAQSEYREWQPELVPFPGMNELNEKVLN